MELIPGKLCEIKAEQYITGEKFFRYFDPCDDETYWKEEFMDVENERIIAMYVGPEEYWKTFPIVLYKGRLISVHEATLIAI